ncbi:MAG: methylmalonyl-CoA carboxyltransferase [Actinomycetota bacterium]|nr:methylmalonyl-CoA carboxyltransferase [Actinomycetota bacterium]
MFRLEGGDHRGALGPAEGLTIERLVEVATDLGVPILGVVSTSGADVGHGVASLHAWGRVARAVSQASGVVPVAAVVSGPCVSGPALLLGVADIVVMTSAAFAYVSGPMAVRSFTGREVGNRDLGGADIHALRTGLAWGVEEDEDAGLHAALDALSYFPSNNHEEAPHSPSPDPVGRDSEVAASAVPASQTASYDVRTVIEDVVDAESFYEVRRLHAPNMVTGLATVGGQPVGIIANQPSQMAGAIDVEAASKAARLVQLCDAFNVALLTFVDTPGFQPGKDIEWQGMIRHGAELVHAYAAATVPRVSVVLRKAYGGAYIVMDSKGMGSDTCLAWPSAEVAVMGAPGAVNILHGRRLAAVEDAAEREQERKALETDYAVAYCTPSIAAERGYVDEIIEPASTRRAVAGALAVLRTKRERLPQRRHANTPL